MLMQLKRSLSRLTAELLKAKAADFDHPYAELDDDDNELDANELVIKGARRSKRIVPPFKVN